MVDVDKGKDAKTFFFVLPFILGEGVLFSLVIALDHFHGNLDHYAVKLSAIVLALVFAATMTAWQSLRLRRMQWPLLFLALALGFTLGADSQLLEDANPLLGVALFMGAQLCHFLRLALVNPKPKRFILIGLLIRLALVGVMVLTLCLLGHNDALTLLGGSYFVLLLLNFGEAAFFAAKQRSGLCLLLAVGFALFIGCDVCVGLRFLGVAGAAPWMWTFYLPSQTLSTLGACFSLPAREESADNASHG